MGQVNDSTEGGEFGRRRRSSLSPACGLQRTAGAQGKGRTSDSCTQKVTPAEIAGHYIHTSCYAHPVTSQPVSGDFLRFLPELQDAAFRPWSLQGCFWPGASGSSCLPAVAGGCSIRNHQG